MSCIHPISIASTAKDAKHGDTMYVPCGKCVGCLADKQRAWIYRIESEQRVSEHSLFVTLTYDVEHLPLKVYDLPFDGVGVIERYSDYVSRKDIKDCDPCLFPKDLTNYFKRVRKALPNLKLKYFACGEYGSSEGSTKRPHYHFALFYSGELPNRVEYVLDKSWNMGFVTIEPLIFNRIKYVTKYMMKDSEESAPNSYVVQPFNRVSHGLGIEGYLLDMQHYYSGQNEFKSVPLQDGTKLGIPRYFRRLFNPREDFYTYDIKLMDDERHKREDAAFKRFCQDYIIEHGSGTFEEINKAYLRKFDYEERERIRRLQQHKAKEF